MQALLKNKLVLTGAVLVVLGALGYNADAASAGEIAGYAVTIVTAVGGIMLVVSKLKKGDSR